MFFIITFIYNRSFDIPLMLGCKYLFKGTKYLVIHRPPPYNRVARPIHNGTRNPLI